MAAPESGKTTIACAASAHHVVPITIITGRSVLSEIQNPQVEFFLFNDMAAIRSLSDTATALLVTMLNQLTQGEKGIVAFAGKERTEITRPIGVIGCLPFSVFKDRRSSWREMGFISRMVPFSYSYSAEIVATIKNSIDKTRPPRPKARTMPDIVKPNPIDVHMMGAHTRIVRALADARAAKLGQIGIRLLKHYHVIVRAHAILHKRRTVTRDDIDFLRAIDQYVSITECKPL